MFRLSLVCVLLAGMIVATLLCGCGGGNAQLTLPAGLVGNWGGVAFDSQGLPDGGGLFQILANGEILVDSSQLTSQASRVPVVVGHVFDENGTFQVALVDPGGGTTATAVGDLDEDGTGAGTWTRGSENGTFQLWKADSAQAAILDITIAGDQTGNGVIDVVAGVISGTITINSVGAADLGGVVTSTGHVVGGWGGGDTLPFVFLEGDNVDGTIGGTWESETGDTGTWTAVSSV